jgi:hypothetical protein
MTVSQWMSWEGGVDLVASTQDGGAPNVIVHLARMVNTPVGSAPSGLVLLQTDPNAAPEVMGFVSTNAKVGAYFGPNIFKDTPFETAPVLLAQFDFEFTESGTAIARVQVEGYSFESRLSQIGPLELVHRDAGSPMPFAQQGLEAVAGEFSLNVNGKPLPIYAPGGSMTGGANAAWAPCGLYAR